MKKEMRAILENFLSKPTEENLNELNINAKKFISDWIELKYLDVTPKKKKYNKAKYKLISEIPNPYDDSLNVSLKEKTKHNNAPYYVICFRDSVPGTRKKDNKDGLYNRRFYFHGEKANPNKMPWIINTAPYIDEILEHAYNAKLFSKKYYDHRKNTKITLNDQYIYSRNLTNDEKLNYLKDLISEDECWALPNHQQELYRGSDILSNPDDVEFVIDLYAGDASGDEDGSNLRKTLIYTTDDEFFTIRGTTTNKQHKPCVLIEGSEWRIDNSMPEISTQSAEIFYKHISPFHEDF